MNNGPVAEDAPDDDSSEVTSSTNPGAGVQAGSFADGVQPHWLVMQRFAARLVPIDERDDLLQDVLERAWRKWRTFDPDRGSAQSWLLAIVVDRARRFRQRARPVAVALDDRDDRSVPDRDLLGDMVLRSAVELLTERRRTAVELYCAEGTVKATLSAARAELRDILELREDS